MSKLKTALASAALIAGLGLTGMASAAPVALHAYDLNGDLTDALGGPDLAQTGGTLGASSFSFAAGDYLTLAAPGLSDSGDYAIELKFQFDGTGGVGGPFYRILNTSAGGTNDDGAYVYQGDVDYYRGHAYQGGTFSMSTMHDYLFSRSSSGISIYLDGALSLSFTAEASSVAAGPIYLFHDNAAEQAPGVIDFARFYDHSLSAGDAAYLYNGGAGRSTAEISGAPEPATWAMMLLGFGGLGALLRRRAGATPLAA